MSFRLQKPLFCLLAALFSSLIIGNSFAEPPNLTVLKHDIIAYHDSGAYERELTAAITKARCYIDQRIAENEKHGQKEKLAIVLDIDETSLSNYQQIFKRDFFTDKQKIHHEILSAKAKVIKPMLALYEDARQHGVSVFFVTGRVPSERQATINNLLNAGYKHWNGLYLRPADYHQPSIVSFKATARKDISKQGYTIIASIGDQFSDFAGGYAERGFKLPNPFYFLP